METDEMIWVDVEHNSCAIEDGNGKEILRCNHYVGMHGNRVCSARKEGWYVSPNEFPYGNRPRIFVDKQEYMIWRLTK